MFDHIEIVTQPAEEPVTLDDLKYHARIDTTDANVEAMLTEILISARESIEKWLNRPIVTQTVDVWFSKLEGGFKLVIPRGVQSITSITVGCPESLWCHGLDGPRCSARQQAAQRALACWRGRTRRDSKRGRSLHRRL